MDITILEPRTQSGSILDLIGNTPLLSFKRVAQAVAPVRVFAKAEWYNPGGSIKDRAAMNMILAGEEPQQGTGRKVVAPAADHVMDRAAHHQVEFQGGMAVPGHPGWCDQERSAAARDGIGHGRPTTIAVAAAGQSLAQESSWKSGSRAIGAGRSQAGMSSQRPARPEAWAASITARVWRANSAPARCGRPLRIAIAMSATPMPRRSFS